MKQKLRGEKRPLRSVRVREVQFKMCIVVVASASRWWCRAWAGGVAAGSFKMLVNSD